MLNETSKPSPGRTVAAAFIILVAFLASGVRSASGDPVPFLYGIGTHGASPESLQMIKDMGVNSVRDDIHWSQVEVTKGVFAMPARYDDYVNNLLRLGLKPLLILDYGNPAYDHGLRPESPEAVQGFVNFAVYVVNHFKGRVDMYEVWNEWNWKAGMPPGAPTGDPVAYVHLLGPTYDAIKKYAPEVQVLGGVVAGTGVEKNWLENACRAGLLKHLDAFSFHSYCFDSSGKGMPEIGLLGQMDYVRRTLQPFLAGRPLDIYLTEFGWPNNTGSEASTPENSARYLARALLLGRTIPFLKGMWWYDWSDDGTNPADKEDNFGLRHHDLSPKPAFFTMQELLPSLRGVTYKSDRQSDGRHFIVRLQAAPNDLLVGLWKAIDEPGEATLTAVFSTPPTPAKVEILGQPIETVPWTRVGPGRWTLHVEPRHIPMLLHVPANDCDVAWTPANH